MAKKDGPRVTDARFLASVVHPDEFPAGPPEIAFCGRSNVGKSSLLNALAQRKAIARTSKTPGRTQRVNLFDIQVGRERSMRFVDLPGYGHAKVPQRIRAEFGPMIEGWLVGSERMAAVALLLDVRRDPEQAAMNFLAWLEQQNLRCEVVFTKIDKVARNRRLGRVMQLATAYELPYRPHATSAQSAEGVGDLRRRLLGIAMALDSDSRDGPPRR